MLSAPSRTVTFLFTDIEGSTRRWERNGAAMADALERHDATVREAIEGHRGQVFKTVGDAFCCTFESAGDAVEAALAVQLALAERDFRAVDGLAVRIAIHTGSASERDGDYFGPTVNRVARLLSIAHGGQVLLSGTTARLLDETLVAGATLSDLGEHYLKDLGRPERIHQVQAPGLRSAFPPLRSVGVIPNNIPAFNSTFVGRRSEVAEIGARLETTRGITLCGTGGIGKTRCALQVGKERIARFQQGVWFVELASLTSGERVAATIAATLGLEPASANALEALCARLKTHSALLVLDNCEHLLQHVSAVVETLLQTCHELRIVATSREQLGYRGEWIYRIPSLSTPPDACGSTPEAALPYDAVSLFVSRAQEVDSNFHLTNENVATVTAICRRLDGLPLALELAAMRLRAIPLAQLETGLRARFRLLTGGFRTAMPRQQTMRALIDWSYELLDESERRLFCGLSVFAGGFTLDACEIVCKDAVDDRHDVLDLLTSLVDKSLVAAPSGPTASDDRFRLIETLREYAAEKLTERGEAPSRHDALARWASDLVETAHSEWVTAATDDWEARYKAEVDNVRAAIEWALAREGEAAFGARIVARSRRMFGALAAAEGLRLIDAALKVRDLPPAVRAELTLGLAQTNIALRRPAVALENARAAFAALGSLGNEEFAREGQIVAGYAQALLGRAAEAKVDLRAAREYFERANLVQFCGVVASDLGVTYNLTGEFEEARAAFDDALRAFRRTRNARGIRAVVANLAEMDFKAGNVESAFDRIAAELAQTGDADALMLSNLSAYSIALDRFEAALEYARESLIAAEASRHEVETLFSLQHVAAALALLPDDPALREDRASLAGHLIGYVDARLDAVGFEREYTELLEYRRLVASLRQRFACGLENLLLEGAQWDDRKAIATAMRA
jgi:predicted ATPase/class 3 adenylate cyclase